MQNRLLWRWMLVLPLTVLLQSCNGCRSTPLQNSQKQDDPDATLVFFEQPNDIINKQTGLHAQIVYSNDIRGRFDPDPTPKRQLGGLNRRFELVDAARKRADLRGEGFLVVDAGDLLYDSAKPSGDIASHERAASQIAEIMVKMGIQAVGLGDHDLAAGLAPLQQLVARTQLPMTNANVVATTNRDKTLFPEHLLIKSGGITFGVFSIISPELLAPRQQELAAAGYETIAPLEVAQKQLTKLKAAGADVVVMLAHMPWPQLFAVADKLKDAGIVVAGHGSNRTNTPEARNGNYIVQTSANGKYLGTMSLVLRKGAVEFFDASRLAQSQIQLLRLQKMHKHMSTGKDKQQPEVNQLKVAGIYERQQREVEKNIRNFDELLTTDTNKRRNLIFNMIMTVSAKLSR